MEKFMRKLEIEEYLSSKIEIDKAPKDEERGDYSFLLGSDPEFSYTLSFFGNEILSLHCLKKKIFFPKEGIVDGTQLILQSIKEAKDKMSEIEEDIKKVEELTEKYGFSTENGISISKEFIEFISKEFIEFDVYADKEIKNWKSDIDSAIELYKEIVKSKIAKDI